VCTMNSTSLPTSRPSRLTRSTSDKKIGGVAGGLAEYFGVDPTLVRIGFVAGALLHGIGLIAYIALLAFVPRDTDAPSAPTPVVA
jgi:phage shock protein C